VRSAALATLIAVTGCADSGARTFAATLSDALETSCRATTRHVAFEQDVLDEIAEDLEEDYASAMLEAPPPPLGRILHLLEREQEVQAWFDVAGSGEPVPFANAGTVYRGEPQDGYVEARFAVTRNTDEGDEDAGLELCGDRLLVEGVLSLTDDDGVQGRIRWLERHHVEAVPSRCLAWIDCARDILVDGLPLD
jgi:hypothetical protein